MSLHSDKGFTLLEIVLTTAVLFLLLSTVAGLCQQRMQRARMEQTAGDMTAIAQATLDYNRATGNWPASIADLAPGYLPQDVSSNAFGYPYMITCATGKVSVSSQTPAGLALNASLGSLWQVSSAGGGHDLVTITMREQIGSLGRLKYDKRYLYNE